MEMTIKQIIDNRIEDLRLILNNVIEKELVKFKRDCYKKYKLKEKK